jgi:hypothetical protein
VAISHRIEDGIIHSAVEGTFTADDVRAHRTAVRNDSAYSPMLPRLIDCREMSTLLPTSDLKALAAELQMTQLETAVRGRYAILVSSDVAFGIARMYGAFVQDALLDLLVFRNADEAVAWLRDAHRAP